MERKMTFPVFEKTHMVVQNNLRSVNGSNECQRFQKLDNSEQQSQGWEIVREGFLGVLYIVKSMFDLSWQRREDLALQAGKHQQKLLGGGTTTKTTRQVEKRILCD